MSDAEDARTYPTRPYLAVSAAIFRDGRVLIVRRARPPAHGLYTLPGGGVELGETLEQAVIREVREETALEIEPVELVGFRQAIVRDAEGTGRTAFRHSAVCRAFHRRRNLAQRGTGRSAMAGAAGGFRTEHDRGFGRDRRRCEPTRRPGRIMPGSTMPPLWCLPQAPPTPYLCRHDLARWPGFDSC